MSELILRPTVIGNEQIKNDFVVLHEGRPVGRIREAHERLGHNPAWDWTITVPLPCPPWTHGSQPDRDEAKAAFREAWDRFYAGLTPHDIEHWHHHQDAAAERYRNKS